uniref:Uncharacterized protein n=1 Tax=Molossus molossus TaxID=27622 RepID=A0A7J8E2H2_MOLMO|nr:hypothetical protein HJG59_008969 [Molossus molossus]
MANLFIFGHGTDQTRDQSVSFLSTSAPCCVTLLHFTPACPLAPPRLWSSLRTCAAPHGAAGISPSQTGAASFPSPCPAHLAWARGKLPPRNLATRLSSRAHLEPPVSPRMRQSNFQTSLEGNLNERNAPWPWRTLDSVTLK